MDGVDVVCSIDELRSEASDANAYLVGVAGYSDDWALNPRPDAEEVARSVLHRWFTDVGNEGHRLWCVSGATDYGVPALAYDEARKMGLPCVGITAAEALQYRIARLERLVIVGQHFGEESMAFVDACERVLLIGGGPQAEREARLSVGRNTPLTVIRGLGGTADRLGPADLPGARFVTAEAFTLPRRED